MRVRQVVLPVVIAFLSTLGSQGLIPVSMTDHSNPSAAPALSSSEEPPDAPLAEAARSLSLGNGPAGGAPWTCWVQWTGGVQCGPPPTQGVLSNVPGRTGNLTQWKHPAASPASMPWQAMVYDAADRYVVLYEGTTTWTFHRGQWQPLVTSTSPSSRYGASIVYDSADGYVLLFGGGGAYPSSSSGDLNDTWTFLGGVWTNLPLTHAPSPRAWAGIADDRADGYVVLYGSSSSGRHETWTYLSGHWRLIWNYPWWAGPPKGPVAMTYDSADAYVVMLAPFPGTSIWNLTWTYSNGTWSNRTANSTARPGFGGPGLLLDDPADGYVLLIGPWGAAASTNATWTYSGGRWSPLPTPSAPAGVAGAAVAYDPGRKAVVFHPGSGAAETWTFAGGNWTNLLPVTGPGPPARYSAGMASSGTGVLLFGGIGSSGGSLGDTWYFADGFWTNLTVSLTSSPSPRWGMSMFADPNVGGVLLFGGTDGVRVFGDAWIFHGSKWGPVPGLKPGPAPRFAAAMAYTPHPSEVILFGGTNGTVEFNDTWLLNNNHWTAISSSSPPPARAGALLVHQNVATITGELTLVGGRSGRHVFNDSWSFAGGKWSLDPGVGPAPPRLTNFTAGFLQSDFGDRAYVFGGSHGGTISSATWSLIFDNWTRSTMALHPAARTEASMAWTSSCGLLLFGGMGVGGPLSDTWCLEP